MNLQDADLLTAIVTPFNEQNGGLCQFGQADQPFDRTGQQRFVIGGTTGERQRSAMTKSWRCIVSLLRSLMAVFR